MGEIPFEKEGKDMRKKRIIAAMLVTAMTVGLTACSGTSETNDDGVKKLSLLMYTDWYKDGWKALEEHIHENAEELGFDIEISTIEGGAQGDQIIETKFATDDLPDLIQVYKPIWMSAHCGGNDKLVDLSDLESVKEYREEDLQGIYYEGDKLCGLPIDTVTLGNVVFYNKKVFEENNIDVPTTYDEFLDVCEYFKNNTDITPLFYSGTDVWTLQVNACTDLFCDASQAGQDISDLMDEINTNKLKYSDNKNLKEQIEASKEWINKGYVQESYLADTFDNAQQAIVEGTAAMYINGTWFTDNIASKYPDDLDNIGAFVRPCRSGETYVDQFTAYTLAVTTGAEDVELAKKAVDYIASSEAQQIYADAQPGVYLNQNISVELPEAVQQIKDYADQGNAMWDWLESNLYSYGNFGTYLADYYAGTYQTADEVLAQMDDETARNAESAGDKNWQ